MDQHLAAALALSDAQAGQHQTAQDSPTGRAAEAIAQGLDSGQIGGVKPYGRGLQRRMSLLGQGLQIRRERHG